MPRFIDADYVKKMAEASYNEDMTEWERGWDDACNAIADYAPTADVVEVVRCKECKHYLHSTEKCALIDTRLHFYETDKTWTDDAFCSWGERREDG